jgi:hypothetical protein
MSDSEDELNVDLSQWKPRTVNTVPEPSAPAPRIFASINAPAAAPTTTNQLDDEDDFDIDAIIEGIADQDDPPESRNSTPPRPTTKTTRRPRQTVQVVINQDPNFNRDDYTDCTYGANILRRVLKEITTRKEAVYYNVKFVDRHTEQVSTSTTALLILPVVASEVIYPLTLPWLSHKPCIHLASHPLQPVSLFTLGGLYRGWKTYLASISPHSIPLYNLFLFLFPLITLIHPLHMLHRSPILPQRCLRAESS